MWACFPDHKRTHTAPNHSDKVDKAPVEADVRGIMTALQAKPDWARKVANPTIVAKWRAEALAQGASAISIMEARPASCARVWWAAPRTPRRARLGPWAACCRYHWRRSATRC